MTHTQNKNFTHFMITFAEPEYESRLSSIKALHCINCKQALENHYILKFLNSL
jgi:hypothetical protein